MEKALNVRAMMLQRIHFEIDILYSPFPQVYSSIEVINCLAALRSSLLLNTVYCIQYIQKKKINL